MDTGALEAIVDEAIAAKPDVWEKYRAGEGKAIGALVGAVMKAARARPTARSSPPSSNRGAGDSPSHRARLEMARREGIGM